MMTFSLVNPRLASQLVRQCCELHALKTIPIPRLKSSYFPEMFFRSVCFLSILYCSLFNCQLESRQSAHVQSLIQFYINQPMFTVIYHCHLQYFNFILKICQEYVLTIPVQKQTISRLNKCLRQAISTVFTFFTGLQKRPIQLARISRFSWSTE